MLRDKPTFRILAVFMIALAVLAMAAPILYHTFLDDSDMTFTNLRGGHIFWVNAILMLVLFGLTFAAHLYYKRRRSRTRRERRARKFGRSNGSE